MCPWQGEPNAKGRYRKSSHFATTHPSYQRFRHLKTVKQENYVDISNAVSGERRRELALEGQNWDNCEPEEKLERTSQIRLLDDLNVGSETIKVSSKALSFGPTKLLKLLVAETGRVLSPMLNGENSDF